MKDTCTYVYELDLLNHERWLCLWPGSLEPWKTRIFFSWISWTTKDTYVYELGPLNHERYVSLSVGSLEPRTMAMFMGWISWTTKRCLCLWAGFLQTGEIRIFISWSDFRNKIVKCDRYLHVKERYLRIWFKNGLSSKEIGYNLFKRSKKNRI